jgi:hypothetical protein
MRGLGLAHEIEGAADQSNMREGLRKIADEPLGARIIFLAEQADVVAKAGDPLEQGSASRRRFCSK